MSDTLAPTLTVPEGFTKVACMACSFSNTQTPGCIGGKSSGACFCVRGYQSCFKLLEGHERACCLIGGINQELVVPSATLHCYQQLFCWECFCDPLPSPGNAFIAVPDGLVPMPPMYDNASKDPNEACIAQSGCHNLNLCVLDFPRCCGMYENASSLCFEAEIITARWMCWDERKPNPDTLCILRRGNGTLIKPYTLCKGVNQVYLCERRWACPCDDDVPCTCTLLPFCMCCVGNECKCGCCMTMNQVFQQMYSKNGGRYPASYRGTPGAAGTQGGAPQQPTGVVIAQQPGAAPVYQTVPGGDYQMQAVVTAQPVDNKV